MKGRLKRVVIIAKIRSFPKGFSLQLSKKKGYKQTPKLHLRYMAYNEDKVYEVMYGIESFLVKIG